MLFNMFKRNKNCVKLKKCNHKYCNRCISKCYIREYFCRIY